jgi:hypothetical protein
MEDEGLIKLIEMLVKDKGLSVNLRYKLRVAIDPSSHIIAWHNSDMEALADSFEDSSCDGYKVNYNRDLIPLAMEAMIDNYDCSVGISYDTLEYYLEEYCRDLGEE